MTSMFLQWLNLGRGGTVTTDGDAKKAVVVGDVVINLYIFKQTAHLRSHGNTVVARIVDNVLEDLDIVSMLIPGIDVNADFPCMMHMIPISLSIGRAILDAYALLFILRAFIVNMIVLDLERVRTSHRNILLPPIRAGRLHFVAVNNDAAAIPDPYTRRAGIVSVILLGW